MRDTKPNIADRIFDARFAEDELSHILEEMIPEYWDFIIDDGYDYYDGSVELIFSDKWRGFTREEVDVILDQGFCIVYETIGKDRGIYWRRGSKAKCHPAKGDVNKLISKKHSNLLMKLGKIDAHESREKANETI